MFRNVAGAVILAIVAIGNRLGVVWRNEDDDENSTPETNLNNADGTDGDANSDYDLVEKPTATYWSCAEHVPDNLLRIRRKDGSQNAQLVINCDADGILMTNDANYPRRVAYSFMYSYEWDSCDNPGEWEDCVTEGNTSA